MSYSYEEIVKNIIENQAELNPLVKAQPVNLITQTAKAKGDEAFLRAMQVKIRKLELMYDYNRVTEELGPEAKAMIERLAELEATHLNGGIPNSELYGYFITVNPRYDENTDTKALAEELLKSAQKLSRKKGVFTFHYCIEQGGKAMEEMGKHPHLHMLVQRNIAEQSGQPSRLKKGIESTFKKFGTSQLNIKNVKTGTEQSRILYIQGKKSDSSKIEMVQIDNQWRKMIGLKNYYTN